MGHQESYRHNQDYTDFLAGWDETFYAKYADTLKPQTPGDRVLDVGCGVGQVLRRLQEAGYEAVGVEVSESNLDRARESGLTCQFYDGRHLPFPDGHFASVGALNVIEHVEAPEALIPEMARVTRPGGRVLISSPNFLRVLGWRDYHPKMRGLRNKWNNWLRLREKRRQIRCAPQTVRFDRLIPVERRPIQPDDDAIIATNSLEIAFFLRQAGCTIERIECTDRYVSRPLDFVLNLTPLRHLLLNTFVVAQRKPNLPPPPEG